MKRLALIATLASLITACLQSDPTSPENPYHMNCTMSPEGLITCLPGTLIHQGN